MTKATLDIHGGKQLQRKLDELPGKVQRRVASKAMRAGAKVVQPEVRKRAPKRKGSGLLSKAFKVRAGRRKKGMIRFLVQTKEGDYKGKTFYGSFITFGRKTGKRINRSAAIGKNGKRRRYDNPRRQIAPNPFIAEAFDAKKYEAIRAIQKETADGIKALTKIKSQFDNNFKL